MHAIFIAKPVDGEQAQGALAFWRTINLLPDDGFNDLSAGVVFNFVSRRAMSGLHIDPADGTCTQWLGKKLWVLVDAKEAAQHGIKPLHNTDIMREKPAGVHDFSAWLKCKSFQWCILNEGETIIQPRGKLHAVSCIGDIDSISAGVYCWIEGTTRPIPPSAEKEDEEMATGEEEAAALVWVKHSQIAKPEYKQFFTQCMEEFNNETYESLIEDRWPAHVLLIPGKGMLRVVSPLSMFLLIFAKHSAAANQSLFV